MSDTFEPMELERKAKRGTSGNGGGHTGYRKWLCKYEDRNGDWAPVPYQSRYTDNLNWPHCWEDELVCVSVDYDYDGPAQPDQSNQYKDFSYCIITANYASAPQLIGNWEVQSRGKVDFMKNGIGQVWKSDGTTSDQQLAVPVTCEEIVVSKVFAYSSTQINNIRAAQGHTNAEQFMTPWGDVFAPECLLLETFDKREFIDTFRGVVLNQITFHFMAKTVSHNLIWREPQPLYDKTTGLQQTDSNNQPLFYGVGKWDRYVDDPFPGTDFSLCLHE